MTITVQSHDPKADALVNQPKEVEPKAEAKESKTEQKSAPEAHQATEQNASEESGTPETEEEKSETKETEPKEADEDSEEEELETAAEAESEKDKKPKKGGWQRRIDKKTKENAELKQRVAYLEQLALKNAGTESKETPKSESKTSYSDGKPDPNNFSKHEDYLDARDEWNRKRWQADQTKEKLESEKKTTLQSYNERLEAFRSEHEDFDEILENLDEVPRSPTVEQVIVSAKDGPELLYELAKDPKEAKRIANLPPIEAAVEIGQIRARISAQKSSEAKPETKRVSSAPKPIAPVSGGGKAGSAPKSLDELAKTDFAAYKRAREEELKLKRRRA